MSKGIDWGWGKIPASVIVNNGYEFVCRYLSNSPAKNLSLSELKDLQANNLDVVLVWETTTDRALGGHDAGVVDAQKAVQEALDLGLYNPPIYFACDDDFNQTQLAKIKDYFNGIATIMDKSKIGVYGGYSTVKYMFDNGLVTYGWQTYAWSHGQWDERAQLRQTNIYGPKLDGIECDSDESVADDFGQI